MLNGSPMNLRGKYFLDAIPIDSIEKVEIVKRWGDPCFTVVKQWAVLLIL